MRAAGAVESHAVSEPSIDSATVAKVARLARLALSDAEVDSFAAQLAGIMEHFRDVDALDLAGVEPLTQPYELVNVLRPDVAGPCLDRDEVLAEAPDPADGRFRVPPIIGLDQ